jgi:hypothetical protein
MACAAGGNAGSGEAALAALEPDRAGPRVTGHQTGTGQDGSAAPPLLVVLLVLFLAGFGCIFSALVIGFEPCSW